MGKGKKRAPEPPSPGNLANNIDQMWNQYAPTAVKLLKAEQGEGTLYEFALACAEVGYMGKQQPGIEAILDPLKTAIVGKGEEMQGKYQGNPILNYMMDSLGKSPGYHN